MTEMIWVPDWEIQCCGKPFAVGTIVQWEVAVDRAEDRFADLFAGTPRPRSTYAYTVHETVPVEDAYMLEGEVVSIRAMHYATHADHDADRGGVNRRATPRTATLTTVGGSRTHEPAIHDDARFLAGWYVRVEVHDLRPDDAGVAENDRPRYRPRAVDALVLRLRKRRAATAARG